MHTAKSAYTSRFAAEPIVLLDVTSIRFERKRKCKGSETKELIAPETQVKCDLDYNQLKRVILHALSETGPTDSTTLLEKLTSVGSEFEIHAVRMALVRYYRQGLLTRVRAGGQFMYTLSSRGTARLRWLEEQLDVHG